MAQLAKISVIGAGSWGTAVANVAADRGNDVTLWARDAQAVENINRFHENAKYLKGLPLSPKLKASNDLVQTLQDAEIVVSAIPTQQIRNVYKEVSEQLSGKILLNTAKGIEQGTGYRVSEVFAEVNDRAHYVVLSGPNFAKEVVQRLPAATTIASEHSPSLEKVQKLFSNAYFRVYSSEDVVGVELGGALKNIVAIAAGIADGLKLGYNAQAGIINRGLVEIGRMGRTLGADQATFLGLSGTGDLILTCTGPLSRNRNLGIALGKGKRLGPAVEELGGVAEGYYTARSAFELSGKLKIEMPITDQVYQILYENQTAQDALRELMARDLKSEAT